MSAPITLEHQHRLPPHHRVLPLPAVAAAQLLATLRPSQLHRILEFARRGARPATAQQAHTARQAVDAVSLRFAGKDCLQRSLATTLYCRAHGTWSTWCTGVRTNPFAAHAWTQVDNQPIGEPHPPATTDPYTPSHPPHPEKPRADPFTPRYSAMNPDPSTMRQMGTLFRPYRGRLVLLGLAGCGPDGGTGRGEPWGNLANTWRMLI
jgi:Transglutaminase-like superfamily